MFGLKFIKYEEFPATESTATHNFKWVKITVKIKIT